MPDSKPLFWVGSSRSDLSRFPDSVRREVGLDLRLLQSGGQPRSWKSMVSVGPGAYELRVRMPEGAFRVVYVAKFREAIYVLHAFQKKSQQTARLDIQLARSRYAIAMRSREGA
ncbi:MAG TPA: type II toxin-antitoxin system RelE/ParE family toxin [Gemmatimonadaceae bacterium]|nr:type II toxin-antitoxin system RelE/ParE family toxin [Gemmatimonadaceae bacterium]